MRSCTWRPYVQSKWYGFVNKSTFNFCKIYSWSSDMAKWTTLNLEYFLVHLPLKPFIKLGQPKQPQLFRCSFHIVLVISWICFEERNVNLFQINEGTPDCYSVANGCGQSCDPIYVPQYTPCYLGADVSPLMQLTSLDLNVLHPMHILRFWAYLAFHNFDLKYARTECRSMD